MTPTTRSQNAAVEHVEAIETALRMIPRWLETLRNIWIPANAAKQTLERQRDAAIFIRDTLRALASSGIPTDEFARAEWEARLFTSHYESSEENPRTAPRLHGDFERQHVPLTEWEFRSNPEREQAMRERALLLRLRDEEKVRNQKREELQRQVDRMLRNA